MQKEPYQIELGPRNTILVRVPSKLFQGKPLPEAVFTFRVGDPQYEVWFTRYKEQEKADSPHPAAK